MAVDVQVQIHGVEELRRKLKLLPERVGYQAMRRAMRKGAGVIRDAARSNARAFDDPETSESIAKNIAIQGASRRRERMNGGPMMRVGVLGGARQYGNTRENRRKGRVGATYQTGGSKSNPGGDTWYWRFLELGTRHMAKQPFLLSAGLATGARSIEVTAQAMQVELDKELAKLK